MSRAFDDRRYLIPFRSTLLSQIFTDTLVIGGGVAGLRAAVAAAEFGEVIVLAKGDPRTSNTSWAQGGIASVLDGADSLDDHIRDTHVAGAGLCDDDAVEAVVRGGPRAIEEILSWGMRLDRAPGGEPALGLEGGHSHARIVHSFGDATGKELLTCLLERAKRTPNLRHFDRCFALDLITPGADPGAPVMGAVTSHPRYGLQVIWARSTILATGGAGVVYRETTNPSVATADGLAMAYRAGATLADMAFTQFHPTTLYLPGASRSLISEAVRGEGAHLIDSSGHRFMKDVHPLAELAPRDVVSRAIVRQLAKQAGQEVFLDCRHLSDFARRFPTIFDVLKRFKLDPVTDLIPVHPAAHYFVGGVRTDVQGRTDVPGLFAVGEVACCGLHGANRLASNSLLEGLVIGAVVGRIAGEAAKSARPGPVGIVSDIPLSDAGELDLTDVRSSLRSAMWRNVGIERTGAKLHDVVDMLEFWGKYTLDKIFDDPTGWETQNMLLVGRLMAASALWREESRGCHTRIDIPDTREEFAVHDCWRRGREDALAEPLRRTAPVVHA